MRRLNLSKRLEGFERLAILGIGSELKGDDAVGPLIINKLQKRLEREKGRGVRAFLGGTAPENITSEIVSFLPTHILIVDAADMGLLPGQYALIGPETGPEVASSAGFSTHALPVSVLIEYIQWRNPCKAYILGVQPKSMELNAPLSVEAAQAVEEITSQLSDLIYGL